MHTSKRLTAEDFNFWQRNGDERRSIPFAEFCTDYHELDRVGVVSPTLADGALHIGQTLLALTTAFYDALRTRGDEFFDYPQHFAFVGTDDLSQYPQTPGLWNAWSKLDVWPPHKWISTPPTATHMIERVFDYQINRLFWPRGLRPTPDEEALPDYAYQMVQTRLKAVYYYSPVGELDKVLPLLEISGSAVVADLMETSIAHLPTDATQTEPADTECFQCVAVEEFITDMQINL